MWLESVTTGGNWKVKGAHRRPSRKGHVYCFEMARLSSGHGMLTVRGMIMNKVSPRHINNSTAWSTGEVAGREQCVLSLHGGTFSS